MTFDQLNLNKPLLNALDDLGFNTPTHIQEAAFSKIMSGRDVIGIAQTGTGKTLAYLLPCLRMWTFAKDRHPQILIVVPTRELVEQVVNEARSLTPYMTAHVVGVYGGTNIRGQIEEVERGLDILVATPGRLLDLCLKGALKLRNIKKLIIDEVDEMLNLGFLHQLTSIFDLLPAKRQNLMFSATMTEEVEELMETFFNNPEKVEAAPVGTPLENIEQYAYRIPNFKSKTKLLKYLLQQDANMNKVLIFVATKKLADLLFDELEQDYPTQLGVIHSNKSQNHRFNTVHQFKAGTYKMIIATDIIARGIDIAGVSHVINFDLPEEPENYMHRIGRTGRADENGIALSFIGDNDKAHLAGIELLMGRSVPMKEVTDDIEITDELIPYEIPEVSMKINLTKKPTIRIGGAFQEKKKATPIAESRRKKIAKYKDKKKKKVKKW